MIVCDRPDDNDGGIRNPFGNAGCSAGCPAASGAMVTVSFCDSCRDCDCGC
jgi:hypothetical protein